VAGESKIREYLKDRVTACGGELRALNWFGRRSAPDVLVMFPVKRGFDWQHGPFFVETKAPGGEPTDAQEREHERMRAAGCNVLVLSTKEQIDQWLSQR
jgi:hypothetical protein